MLQATANGDAHREQFLGLRVVHLDAGFRGDVDVEKFGECNHVNFQLVDVFGISQTRLKEGSSPQAFCVPGFALFSSNRDPSHYKEDGDAGGVGLLLRNELAHSSEAVVVESLPTADVNLEQIWRKIQLPPGSGRHVLIGVVHREKTRDVIARLTRQQRFDLLPEVRPAATRLRSLFKACTDMANAGNMDLILMGNFGVHARDAWYLELLAEFELCQHVTKTSLTSKLYTENPSVHDHIITNIMRCEVSSSNLRMVSGLFGIRQSTESTSVILSPPGASTEMGKESFSMTNVKIVHDNPKMTEAQVHQQAKA